MIAALSGSTAETSARIHDELSWGERTDVEIARMLSLSQPGISKQKRRILALLGFWIGRLEENKIIREFG